MSEKDRRISESTVARIAGNLLSGTGWVEREENADGTLTTHWIPDDALVVVAVAAARAIVAEVERTAKE